MIDTNSVWIIVISLLLVAIFVLGYYFYIEMSQKDKGVYDSLNNRIEQLEKNVIMNNNYIEDYSDIESYSDESLSETSETSEIVELDKDHQDHSEEKITDITEKEEQQQEVNKDEQVTQEMDSEKIQSVFSDIKSLLGEDSVTTDDMCKHIILSGKRKGEECGKRTKSEGKCSTHI